jgi:glycosyltransferase involved in cell wall biosynthesis
MRPHLLSARNDLKVFNVSSSDEIGGRWNGHDIMEPLREFGVEAKIGSFWSKTSKSKNSIELFPGRKTRLLAEATMAIESLTGRQSTYQSWSSKIFDLPEFQEADVVHLQVIHDHLMTVENMAKVFQVKPAVWTWHDLWPLTGHCTQPVSCARWDLGCGGCPSLDSSLPVYWDRTDKERLRKEKLFSKTPINIHITTDWMRGRIENKVSSWNANVFQFPFGIDTQVFRPKPDLDARSILGIDKEVFVVSARSTDDSGKGFKELVQAIEQVRKTGRKVLLLCIQKQGLVSKYSREVESIELPWTNDTRNLGTFYEASDLFAMPSSAESFGMMALEAMSSGVPVITVANTAASEVAAAPELEVNLDDLVTQLADRITWAIDNKKQLRELGFRARARAEAKFSLGDYLGKLKNMYEQVISDRIS